MSSSFARPGGFTQAELERAASDVIRYMKTLPELADSRVAVFGGLALWKYIPDGRTTDDVDFVINVNTAPGSVKSRLLSVHSSAFFERAQYFFYKAPSGTPIQIDICSHYMTPYTLQAMQTLRTIPNGSVPYISAVDLVTLKIFCCGERAMPFKKRRDAADAHDLLKRETETRGRPLVLAEEQKRAIMTGLPDVILHTGIEESWWKERLGL